jgi:cytochrome c oxidase subunit 4
MSAHDTSADDSNAAGPGEHVRAYNRVFWALALLTALEVALGLGLGERVPGGLLVPALGALAAAKGALIALYYMHLRYDGPLLAAIFVVPLILAAGLAAFALVAR